MTYIEEYKKRWYVVTIKWGIFLFWTEIGNIIGLVGSIAHHIDSNRRIALLEAKLKQMGNHRNPYKKS
ncbi:MAG: hypothetical protein WCH61_08495 [bacterium]